MSNQLIPSLQQYSNNNGATESGLVLHTYEAGTLINKETFQTYGGTSNTNPIVLDSAGYPPAGIYGSGSYRLILKDSEGVTLKDQDNVVLTEGLQPDANGDYLIPQNLEIEGELIIGDTVITDDSGDMVTSIDGNEVLRIDPEGNRSENAAAIPGTLLSTHNYAFKNKSCIMNSKTDDDVFDCVNCYIADAGGGVFSGVFFDITRDATITLNSNGELTEYNIPKSIGNGFAYTDYETRKVDVNGTIAYNKATIQGDLQSAYTDYVFRGNNCDFITNGEARSGATGCYPTSTGNDYKALVSGDISIDFVNVSTGRKERYTYIGAVAGTSYDITSDFNKVYQQDPGGTIHIPTGETYVSDL